MKMICSILLLLSLTSCVSGAFVVNVTQTSYQAEENHNITLEWMFTTRTSSSSKSLFILCRLFTDHKYFVLFHLHGGVEDPESQDEQFTGRVRWDKDVLRDGRIRLHMSRLRINDSGVYQCDVSTGYGKASGICHLKVTAAADEPKPPTPTMRPQPERPTMRPQPESRGWIALYVGLAALLVLCAGLLFFLLHKLTSRPNTVNTRTDLEKSPCDLEEVIPLEERGQREEMIVVSSISC
ncbi:butyrophilin subfamily 2 member A1-like isoform X1 [Sebastes umbrosus]|uniref:butyrophilin subfamily 2 member A1-like isoform X1 n=1 Tax=Sebastes umbrosus TaxID=72105 RepID=UPI0018A10B0A|nr:butyrophilin subfamily 2 member A1-like isoform X1 [Sebastes umbrosus]